MALHETAYEGIADLLATVDPQKLKNLRASDDVQCRLEQLIKRSTEATLSETERYELNQYIVLERLVRLAKIHARANQIC